MYLVGAVETYLDVRRLELETGELLVYTTYAEKGMLLECDRWIHTE
jgi:hypothetical protein